MKVLIKGIFYRDVAKAGNKELRHALDNKITQLEKARTLLNVTGALLLEGYSHHYRIIVRSKKHSYRIGAIVRGETIWLVRFLPRRIIYKSFP